MSMSGKTMGDIVIGFALGVVLMTVIIVGLSACGPTPEPRGPSDPFSSDSHCEWKEITKGDLPKPSYFIHCGHAQCVAIIADDRVELDCR
jgi:hypothetical protein